MVADSVILDCTNDLDAKDLNAVIRGLNKLLTQTHDHSAQISQISVANIAISIGSLWKVVNGINVFTNDIKTDDSLSEFISGSSQTVLWDFSSENFSIDSLTLMSQCSQENYLLLMSLAIIRNLSFEYNNEILFASSAAIIHHLTSLLLVSQLTGLSNENVALSIDILNNIISKVNFGNSAKQRMSVFEDCCINGKKDNFQIQMSPYFSIFSIEYRRAVGKLFSVLFHLLKRSTKDRAIRVKILELYGRILTVPDNLYLFHECPSEFLEILVDLLATSFSSINPLTISDLLNHPSSASHTSTLVVHSTAYAPVCNFFTDILDIELRDLSIEIIHALCIGSVNMQFRFAEFSRILRILYLNIRFHRAAVGSIYRTTDTILQKTSQVFTLLISRTPPGCPALMSLHGDLCIDALSDENLADALCNNPLSFANMSTMAPAADASSSAMSAPIDKNVDQV